MRAHPLSRFSFAFAALAIQTPFHHFHFLFGQPIQFIHQRVNLRVGSINLPLIQLTVERGASTAISIRRRSVRRTLTSESDDHYALTKVLILILHCWTLQIHLRQLCISMRRNLLLDCCCKNQISVDVILAFEETMWGF